MPIDDTHDRARTSWVPGSEASEFTLQNLPYGIFSPSGQAARPGVAIGDHIVDLQAAGLMPPANSLNAFLGAGAGPRRDLRRSVWRLLEVSAPKRTDLLHPMTECRLHLPCTIGDYTDFYAGIHHATNSGKQFRPDQPLLPNYKHVPVAYHGRASSVRVSGAPVRRPHGQRKPARDTEPSFGPSRNLDFELELGVWIGRGNTAGEPIPIAEAADHIAGFCLLNDWSARDIQGWEAQPLGPFLAKNFCTTVSPWVITPEALEPYRCRAMPRPEGDPAPMPHLTDAQDQRSGGLDLALAVTLAAGGRPPHSLTRGSSRDLYWTVAQMVAHHTTGGCDLRPGDLFGTGTISGASAGSEGSLLEITQGGRQPVELPGGGQRRFLEDGDEITLTARFGPGGSGGGFGPCAGRISAA